MNFEQLKQAWQELGASDPRWAILSEPGRKGGGGDDASFWQSGVGFIAWMLHHLEGLGAPPVCGRALDFGCGHGRLTQALAQHFGQVVGVDIAESMLAGARLANKHGDRVTYVHNARPDLSLFPDGTFDFVLTALVLQHMRPHYAAAYVGEFLRVLRPGGLAFFQIPIEPLAQPPQPGRSRTAAGKPLLPASLRAYSSIVPTRLGMSVGDWIWVRVNVHNPGPELLHASGVEVGARFQRDDDVSVTAPVWAELPHDIAPGETVGVLVAVQAPMVHGSYLLAALPAVGRSWCVHSGNVACTIPVRVGKAPSARLVATAPPPRPGFPDPNRKHGSLIEVHGTPLQDVAATVAAGGGDLLHVGLDGWAGYEWVSAHLTVRKRAPQ